MNRHSRQRQSIRWKIIRLVWIAVIPMTLAAIYAIWSIGTFYQQYDQSVSNITQMNEFNVTFEKEMNSAMYYIIVETYDWQTIKTEGGKNNPYEQIAHFRQRLEDLRSGTEDAKILNDIEAIEKMLGSLEKRVDEIIDNVESGGKYDESMEMLQSNVNVLTNLIQKDIQDYISLEVTNMDQVQQDISERVHLSMTVLALAVVLILLLTVLISARLSKKITEPLQEMCRTTERFAGGDFSVSLKGGSGDEMESLAESFNSMVREISKLVEDIRIEQANAKDAELRLLQAQINPHFLYNTLDAIMWLIESDQRPAAINMLSSLSNFFRTTLSKGRDYVTVAEERSHIRSYLEIQQFRYADILDYEIDIPEEIEGYYLMKLMLQPIVENALYHGIKNKRGKGMIRVKGRQDQTDLVFTVEDNGIGMMASQLQYMRGVIAGEIEEDRSSESTHGFGMANVQQRIRLRCGEGYGISVESTYGEGCLVTVRIPKWLRPPEEIEERGA